MRSRQYPTETMTDADYAVDQALLTNTPAQPQSLLHSLKQAAGGIDLYVSTNKTEFMCFKQKKELSPILVVKTLKLVDKFTYLGSNISSTESDVNMHQVKTWNANDKLLIMWKFDLSNKIECYFLAVALSILLYGCTLWILTHGEKAWWELK